MANRPFKTTIRMGAGGFTLVSTDGKRSVMLDLSQAGKRKNNPQPGRGAIMSDLSQAAATVCSMHGIKDKTLRGAKGKFLKRGKPQFRKERREVEARV